MIKDAEAHAEEDRKARELIESRNLAEQMVHATRKSMKELGDKVGEQEKKDIEAAISGVEDVIKGDNKDVIEEKTRRLTELAGKLAEKAYAEQAQTAQSAETGGAANPSSEDGKADEGTVVDAEFEEVDNDRK